MMALKSNLAVSFAVLALVATQFTDAQTLAPSISAYPTASPQPTTSAPVAPVAPTAPVNDNDSLPFPTDRPTKKPTISPTQNRRTSTPTNPRSPGLTITTIYVCSDDCEGIADDITQAFGGQAFTLIVGRDACGEDCNLGRRRLQSNSDPGQLTTIIVESSVLNEAEILDLAKNQLPGTTSLTDPTASSDDSSDDPDFNFPFGKNSKSSKSINYYGNKKLKSAKKKKFPGYYHTPHEYGPFGEGVIWYWIKDKD